MKKIYISGKISYLPLERAQAKFEHAEARIREAGDFIPVNPMKLQHDHDKAWASYIDEDLAVLKKCDAILMLPCWTESVGAQIEHLYATGIGLPIIYSVRELLLLVKF
jgi:hypothetical protein